MPTLQEKIEALKRRADKRKARSRKWRVLHKIKVAWMRWFEMPDGYLRRCDPLNPPAGAKEASPETQVELDKVFKKG
jgi:hypothetical protein